MKSQHTDAQGRIVTTTSTMPRRYPAWVAVAAWIGCITGLFSVGRSFGWW